jgi:hypothetical protein
MANIIGNDISAIQPNWVCPNVEFVVEDFETEWIYEPASFDFIHARLLAGSVTQNQLIGRVLLTNRAVACPIGLGYSNVAMII